MTGEEKAAISQYLDERQKFIEKYFDERQKIIDAHFAGIEELQRLFVAEVLKEAFDKFDMKDK